MHVSIVPRDEVTNDLERPHRTDIRVVNGALLSQLGSEPGIRCPGVHRVWTHQAKGWSFTCFVLLLSTFRYITGTVSAYLVYTQVLDMGISLSVFTRFRLLVRMTGDLVDLYPRVKERSECMRCGRIGRPGHTD